MTKNCQKFVVFFRILISRKRDELERPFLAHFVVISMLFNSLIIITQIGAITRASKVDFDELSLNIQRLESDCKASWDHLKLIAKHDGSTMMKVKMSDFLADCAERIILLGIIHRRIMNRFVRTVPKNAVRTNQVNICVFFFFQVSQVSVMAGYPVPPGVRHQTQRILSHHLRVCFGVSHHQRTGAATVGEEGESQGTQQNSRQNDY